MPGDPDRPRAAIAWTDQPAWSTSYTRAQVLATAAWLLAVGGLLLAGFPPGRGLGPGWLGDPQRAACVLALWAIVAAQVRRGPLKPPLLIAPRRHRSGWDGDAFAARLPADYARLGQSVPRSAFVRWWVGNAVYAGVAAAFTVALLIGRFAG